MIDSDAPKISLWYRICYHLFLWGLPIRLPDESHVNEKIRNYVSSKTYDVIWIDKGVTVAPETLKFIKEKNPDVFGMGILGKSGLVCTHTHTHTHVMCNCQVFQHDLE